jgi:alkyldihydroxyacetonephosphate synthase
MERWNGWGDPERATALPEPVLDLLRPALGITHAPPDPVPAPELPEPALDLARLREIVGDAHVSTLAMDRVRHTRGKSTVDLLRMRAGDVADAPDAVVRPGSHDEVVEVLTACAADRVAVTASPASSRWT